ncbi:hypothetical protein R3I94_019102 [Phoxinus phoxinus]
MQFDGSAGSPPCPLRVTPRPCDSGAFLLWLHAQNRSQRADYHLKYQMSGWSVVMWSRAIPLNRSTCSSV